MKNNVKVCVRTKPSQYFAQDNIFIENEKSVVVSTDTSHEPAVAGVPNNKISDYKFKFDHIFHNSSQSEVYDLYCRNIVQNIVDGISGAIMTYGQTGSGKTFTMV